MKFSIATHQVALPPVFIVDWHHCRNCQNCTTGQL